MELRSGRATSYRLSFVFTNIPLLFYFRSRSLDWSTKFTLDFKMHREKVLCLFDVDGTLTLPRQPVLKEIEEFLLTIVKPQCTIALVGGSDFSKIAEQMNGDDVIHKFDFVFPENGLVAYKNGEEISRQSIQQFMGEEKLQIFINFVLKYLSNIMLPVKRGTFVEFRSGILNISPVGRSCSQAERIEFEKYDKINHVRSTMIDALKRQFPDIGLTYSIGGQISFDVFPTGWDKTYCLTHVTKGTNFEQIHFFGDKTDPGGNDYEIYNDSRVVGHKVTSPADTRRQLEELLNSL